MSGRAAIGHSPLHSSSFILHPSSFLQRHHAALVPFRRKPLVESPLLILTAARDEDLEQFGHLNLTRRFHAGGLRTRLGDFFASAGLIVRCSHLHSFVVPPFGGRSRLTPVLRTAPSLACGFATHCTGNQRKNRAATKCLHSQANSVAARFSGRPSSAALQVVMRTLRTVQRKSQGSFRAKRTPFRDS